MGSEYAGLSYKKAALKSFLPALVSAFIISIIGGLIFGIPAFFLFFCLFLARYVLLIRNVGPWSSFLMIPVGLVSGFVVIFGFLAVVGLSPTPFGLGGILLVIFGVVFLVSLIFSLFLFFEMKKWVLTIPVILSFFLFIGVVMFIFGGSWIRDGNNCFFFFGENKSQCHANRLRLDAERAASRAFNKAQEEEKEKLGIHFCDKLKEDKSYRRSYGDCLIGIVVEQSKYWTKEALLPICREIQDLDQANWCYVIGLKKTQDMDFYNEGMAFCKKTYRGISGGDSAEVWCEKYSSLAKNKPAGLQGSSSNFNK